MDSYTLELVFPEEDDIIYDPKPAKQTLSDFITKLNKLEEQENTMKLSEARFVNEAIAEVLASFKITINYKGYAFTCDGIDNTVTICYGPPQNENIRIDGKRFTIVISNNMALTGFDFHYAVPSIWFNGFLVILRDVGIDTFFLTGLPFVHVYINDNEKI